MSDYMDRTLGLGSLNGSLILVGILITILTFWRFTVGSLSVENIKTFKVEILYWIAFVLTRPFGATFGDLLTKSGEQGGYDFGTIGSSLILGAILVVLIFYTSVQENKANSLEIV